MVILSRVSQRALWLRRISSMPVSTSVGAEVPGKPRKHASTTVGNHFEGDIVARRGSLHHAFLC